MTATITPYRLWEVQHPYYCETSRWCEHQGNPSFTSWADFIDSAFHSGDRDQNLLIRWDWDTHDDYAYEGPDVTPQVHDLLLFFVLQRKPIFAVAKVRVTAVDEPAIRVWLKECAAALVETWSPFLTLDPNHA
jgi:hypothetical protein